MLIRRPGQTWHALQPALHDERAIQTLLAQSPGLLPSPGPGELAVASNFRMGTTGSADLLGVGVDGRVVLVECGRQEGPGRRPMGGASLTVAAGLWQAPYEEFERAFAVRAGVPLADSVANAAKAAGVAWNEATFRAVVSSNLAMGRFQLILAVDTITDEVRRVVSYLNSGPGPGLTTVALGLRYLAEEGLEILIPSVYRGDNVTAPAETPPPPPPPRGNASAAPAAAAAAPVPNEVTLPADGAAGGEDALFAALEATCLPAAVESVRQLFNRAKESGQDLQWGNGEHPSVTAVYDIGGRPVGLWSCYTDLKPSFVVNFEWLVPHVGNEQLEQLAEGLGKLQSVPERLAGLAEAGYRRRLALAVNAVLAQPGAADVIAEALDQLLQPAPEPASS